MAKADAPVNENTRSLGLTDRSKTMSKFQRILALFSFLLFSFCIRAYEFRGGRIGLSFLHAFVPRQQLLSVLIDVAM
jgi:hypothetical protein